ncbi:MAG: HAD-IA family hydrolase [Planctomycetes bacterium]|nr:HAD-IA family hydrolase [Planctomycetota bacterium]
MPSAAPAFLFDLDGTLADTLADIAASTNHVRERHGLPPADLATVRTFVGDGARTLLRRALAAALDSATDPEAALDDAFATYAEHHLAQCIELVRPYPGVRAHLESLCEAGQACAVVTNKPERFARRIVDHLELAALFPVVVGGDTLPVRKPDPAPLRHALDRLGGAERAVTMIGDGVQDLRAGKAIGARTVACLYGFTPAERLRAEGADTWWTAFGVESTEATGTA